MGWYFQYQRHCSGRLTDNQAGKAICQHFYARTPRPFEHFLPRWRFPKQAIAAALIASICAQLLWAVSFELLFSAHSISKGIITWLLCGMLSLFLQCWGWGGLWRISYYVLAYRRKALKSLSILGFFGSLLFSAITASGWILQLPIWYQTFDNSVVFSLNAEKTQLTMEGTIGRESARKLAVFLKENKNIQSVRLHLYGGLVEEARKMHQIIALHSLKTEVLKECSSACTIVFMAGKTREIGQGARMGFHRYHYVAQSDSHEADLLEQAYLISLGMPSDFVSKALEAETVWYPSLSELYRANIVTAQVLQ